MRRFSTDRYIHPPHVGNLMQYIQHTFHLLLIGTSFYLIELSYGHTLLCTGPMHFNKKVKGVWGLNSGYTLIETKVREK